MGTFTAPEMASAAPQPWGQGKFRAQDRLSLQVSLSDIEQDGGPILETSPAAHLIPVLAK